MKRYWLGIVFFLVVKSTLATHIVGGEFEMVHTGIDATGMFKYNFGLVLYFDLKNGSRDILYDDPSRNVTAERLIQVRIFRKRDNAVMLTFMLKRVEYGSVPYQLVKYFQEECSSGNSIETARLFFQYAEFNGLASQVNDPSKYTYSELKLSPTMYNDPEGYYVAWERCCRNYSITNIFSEDPNRGGTKFAGQTFYLEFPALRRNGQNFINSSPTLFRPLSDYACPYRLYYVNFGGTDLDGDSLVYSLVEPYNTFNPDAIPNGNIPGAGPYPSVNWRPPFGMDNIMMGDPDLKISTDGLLTVTPTVAGLFAFAVKCEEYRDGEKIGEIRRDFQMLVLSDCPLADAPIVQAKPIGGVFQSGTLNVEFSNTTTDDSRCVIIQVRDPSSEKIENGNQDEIKIRAVPLGFKNSDVEDILPEITDATLINGSIAEFTVCFPKCPYILGPYKIGIIAEDNSCPLPLLDTIVVTVDVELPPNSRPYFADDEIIQTVREGSGIVSWNILGLDVDDDPLVLNPVAPIGYSLTDYGFTYAQTLNQNGRVEATLSWDSRCDVVDFTTRTNFPFYLLLNDLDECELLPSDTMRFDLTMDLYDFHWPVIEYVPDPTLEEVDLTTKIYEPVNFNVRGTDADNEVIVLAGEGLNFLMTDVGVTFPTATANGEVESTFSWLPHCDKVKKLGKYSFQFIVTNDDNRCNYHLADTLLVNVQVNKPDNIVPVLTANSVEGELELEYTLGDPIVIPLLGTDGNTNPADLLTLTLDSPISESLPDEFSFEPQQGYGTVEGLLTWNPDCDIFNTPDYTSEFNFVFKVTDGRCFTNEDSDNVTINLTIKDIDKEEEDFLPPNFISPNGDAWNNYFAMVKRDDMGNLVSILPKDNCSGVFISINIFNRWGAKVFESSDRDFKWYAEDSASGAYFYTIKYSNIEYKGIISVASGQ